MDLERRGLEINLLKLVRGPGVASIVMQVLRRNFRRDDTQMSCEING